MKKQEGISKNIKKIRSIIFFTLISFIVFFKMFNVFIPSQHYNHFSFNLYLKHFSSIDWFFILSNPIIFFTHIDSYFRPISSLLLLIFTILFKKSIIAFHVTYFIIHLINGYLLYSISKLYKHTEKIAFLFTLIYLIHPIHSTIIFNPASITILLSTLFILCSFRLLITRKISLFLSIILCVVGFLINNYLIYLLLIPIVVPYIKNIPYEWHGNRNKKISKAYVFLIGIVILSFSYFYNFIQIKGLSLATLSEIINNLFNNLLNTVQILLIGHTQLNNYFLYISIATLLTISILIVFKKKSRSKAWLLLLSILIVNTPTVFTYYTMLDFNFIHSQLTLLIILLLSLATLKTNKTNESEVKISVCLSILCGLFLIVTIFETQKMKTPTYIAKKQTQLSQNQKNHFYKGVINNEFFRYYKDIRYFKVAENEFIKAIKNKTTAQDIWLNMANIYLATNEIHYAMIFVKKAAPHYKLHKSFYKITASILFLSKDQTDSALKKYRLRLKKIGIKLNKKINKNIFIDYFKINQTIKRKTIKYEKI